MRVTVFRDMKAEGWPSMDRYADHLVQSSKKFSADRITVDEFCFEQRDTLLSSRKLAKYVARALTYPRKARWFQGEVNHVIDHSYAHLLYSLDPGKTVVTCHDSYPLAQRSSLPNYRVGTLLWNWSFRGMMRAARIICDSQFTRSELLRLSTFPEEHVSVVYLGVDDRFAPKQEEARLGELRQELAPDSQFLLLHVGHCGARKNIEGLLRVLSGVKDQGIDSRLVQVGGYFTKEQQRLASRLDLDGRIVQFHSVSEDDLQLLYSLADVFVFPSLYEGFGLTPLEAMACGSPVISSKAASLPEVVGEAGILLDPTDIRGFVEAVAGVLRNGSRRDDMRKKGLERAKLFGWDKCAEETLEVYEGLYSEIHKGQQD